MALSAKQVEGLKPTAKEYAKADRDGLALRVRPSGRKSWIWRYTYGGKADKQTLGTYPKMSLKQARDRAAELASVLENGGDPKEYVREQEQEKSRRRYDIASLWNEFDALQISKRRRPEQARYLALTYIIPKIGKLPCIALKKHDVLQLFQPLHRTPGIAKSVFTLLKQMLEFGINRGEVKPDCIYGLKAKDVGGTENKRERNLSFEEVRTLLHQLPEWSTTPTYKNLIMMLLASGQRISTVLSARWSEFDLEKKVWNIPASSNLRFTKSNKERRLPLSDLMIDILEQQQRYRFGSGDCVFPKVATDSPPDNTSVNATIRRCRLAESIPPEEQLEPFSPHDLRRTFASRVAEMRLRSDIAERVMGHSIKSTQSHYQHHDFLEEQLELLNAWGQRLQELTVGNVVHLPTASEQQPSHH